MENGGLHIAPAAPAPPPPPPAPPRGVDHTTRLAAARAAAGLTDADVHPGVDPPRVDPSGVDPSGVDPSGVDPSGPGAGDVGATEVETTRRRGMRRAVVASAVALVVAAVGGYVVVRDGGDRAPASTLAPTRAATSSSASDLPATTPALGVPPPIVGPEPQAPAFRYTWAADDGRAVDVTVISASDDLLVRLDDGTAQRRVDGVWATRRPDGAWIDEPAGWEPPVSVERLAPTRGPLRPADVLPPAFDGFTLSRVGTTNPVGNRVVEITLDDVALNRHDSELRTFWMQRWGLDPSVVSVAPLVLIMVLTPDDMVRSLRIELTAHETGLNYDLVDVLDEVPSLDLP